MSQGQWSSLADTPENVSSGGAMVHTSGAIYAFRGGNREDFWRHRISTNSWEELDDAPESVDDGGALALLDDAVYVLRGDNNDDFWKLSPLPASP